MIFCSVASSMLISSMILPRPSDQDAISLTTISTKVSRVSGDLLPYLPEIIPRYHRS
jgi:hypothetical protein